jgi:hypothetical protein
LSAAKSAKPAKKAPAGGLKRVADAPPTIKAALAAAFKTASIYFPFSYMFVADPYAALTNGVKLAFYVGPSVVIDAPSRIGIRVGEAIRRH